MAEILPDIEAFARIRVVGVGGGGGNSLNSSSAKSDAWALAFSSQPDTVWLVGPSWLAQVGLS